MSATVVSADTLDLLVTAALRYGVLTSRTRSAFSAPSAGVLQATPDDAGRVLLAQYLAAQRPTMAAPPPLSSELRCYQHVPVAHVDPVHVLKAIHTYETVAAAGPGWDTSAAHTLTTALFRAAVKALPGYSAPSSWRRPPVRSGPPIGLARQVATRPRRCRLDDCSRARGLLGVRGRRAAHRRRAARPAP